MAGRSRLANDAWEALLTAHAEMIKQLAAEDVWSELSMREYDAAGALSDGRSARRAGTGEA
jgi:hypothetical protein